MTHPSERNQHRILAVLPAYGLKTMRKAAYDGALSDVAAWAAVEALIRAGAVTLPNEKRLWRGSVLALSDVGRDLQARAMLAAMAGQVG